MKLEIVITENHLILSEPVLKKLRKLEGNLVTNEEILENPKTASRFIDEIFLRSSQVDDLKSQVKKYKNKNSESVDKKSLKEARKSLKAGIKGTKSSTKKKVSKKKTTKTEPQAVE